MMKQQNIYITAAELAEIMGISNGHAYKLIREMNADLKKQGFLTISGKLPRAYLVKCLYGFSALAEGSAAT